MVNLFMLDEVAYDSDMFGRIVTGVQSKSLVKFFVVGGLSFGIDYGLLLVLFHIFQWQLAVATTTAFLIGLLVNFLLNKYWTFEAPRGARHAARQSVLYALLVGFNLLFTDIFIVSLAAWHVRPEFSKPMASAIIMILNYVLYQKVIFKPHKTE